MILLAALLALQASAPDPAGYADILVVARQLEAVQVNVGRDARGRLTCGLNGSSGNARLDARLCKASATCARKQAFVADAVKACVTASKPRLLASFRDEWAGSRAR